jgi:hydroxyacid-oxoacid transhydrogenase
LECAQLFGVDISNVKREDAGKVLGDAIRKFLHSIDVPDGIGAIGFKNSDIEKLVLGTLPQVIILLVFLFLYSTESQNWHHPP